MTKKVLKALKNACFFVKFQFLY